MTQPQCPSYPVPEPRYLDARDGVTLAFRELGSGRPLILLHGFASNAEVNWIRFGHAARLAEAGFRVILPDMRAHGDSATPHDAGGYRPDVLTDDASTVIESLGLREYDLGGYSLGARTVVRLLARGARPGRAVIAGMGWEGIVDPHPADGFFGRLFDGFGTHPQGSALWRSEKFIRHMGGDPVALRRILDTIVPTPPTAIEAIRAPSLVLQGDQDHDHGSGEELVQHLPDARFALAPGTHMNVISSPEFGARILEFLTPGV